MFGLYARKKRRDLGKTGRLFGEPWIPGEGTEAAQVFRIAIDELDRPRQSEQNDFRIRQRTAQGAERRHRAQHVAELQSPDDKNAPRQRFAKAVPSPQGSVR